VLVKMRGTTYCTDTHGATWQLAAVRHRVVTGWRDAHAHHAISTSLVIDETTRTELGKRENARSLQERGTASTIRPTGHISHQWQAREVVAREKALRGEISVGVEIAVAALTVVQQQFDLVDGLT